jgi:predicted MFS family arabinose efflux permease
MTRSNTAPALPLLLVARVFLPFAGGYFLSYLYRTVNAVIAGDLVRDFGVDPGALGLLTSVYFLTLAAAQLPLGILLDRFGPRRVNAALLAICAVGAAIFAYATSFGGLLLGRALIGLGVSGALMSAFKAFVVSFPSTRLASVNGLLMAVGGLGAIAASAPVEALLQHTDWRGVFRLLAGASLAVSVLLLLIVPRSVQAANVPESLGELVAGVGKVFRDGVFWRISLVVLTAQAGFLAAQGLWVGPWLQDVAGLPRHEVAQYLLWMAFAVTAGFAFFGNAADRFAHIGLDADTLFRLATLGTLVSVVLVVGGWRAAALPACLLWGFCGTGMALSYAILSQRFPVQLIGRAHTAVNMMVFIGAFLLQWGLGLIIGRWTPENGHYPPEAYSTAFGVLLALQFVCALPVLRRTVPRPAEDYH